MLESRAPSWVGEGDEWNPLSVVEVIWLFLEDIVGIIEELLVYALRFTSTLDAILESYNNTRPTAIVDCWLHPPPLFVRSGW